MKILVLYAEAGAGHRKAGEAVYKALKEIQERRAGQAKTSNQTRAQGAGVSINPDFACSGNLQQNSNAKIGVKEEKAGQLELEFRDVLDFTPALFRFSYPRIYLVAINRFPLFWGWAYYLLDYRPFRPLVSFLRRIFNRLNSGPLIKYLREQSPDVVVATHFFPPEVITSMKRKYGFKTRLEVIVTDLWPHHLWVFPEVDSYLAGSDSTKKELMARGIAEDKITVTGIPISPVFTKRYDKAVVREQLGLERGVFTVLIVGGGFGVGPIKGMAENIDAIESALQMMVICGHNEILLNQLAQIKFKHKIKFFGFVNNMDELMDGADIIVSKSGGLTVSEALAKNLPMIVIRPIPGQETKNCEVLESYGCALRTKNVIEVKKAVEDLISFDDKLQRMKENTVKLARPDSARRIAEVVCRK